jgi:hypothetical protein
MGLEVITMSRRMLALSAALALLLALCVFWALQGRRRERAEDLATAREAVLEYIEALGAKDRDSIARWAPEGYETAEAIDDRLRRFGGVRAAGAKIQIGTDISPEVYVVKIQTLGADGREIAWTENLFWRDGGWRLVLGKARGGFPSSSIQRPAP